MNKRVISLALAGVLTIGAIAIADEGGSNAGLRGNRNVNIKISNAAESGLVRVKLYDPGTKVIAVYGTPDDIQAVGSGGTSVGPVAGGGGAAPASGGPGGNARGSAGGGPRPTASGAPAGITLPAFSFGDEVLNFRQVGGQPTMGAAPAGDGDAGGAAGGGAPGAGGGGGATGQSTRILYTRWIYNRGPARYGFILNNMNKVVQIEAIGSTDSRVYTNRGVRFGSSFADVMKKYGDPDGYEISNDTVVVRYLIKNKVAFRLNRLTAGKPHVVTGIVVAAGKA